MAVEVEQRTIGGTLSKVARNLRKQVSLLPEGARISTVRILDTVAMAVCSAMDSPVISSALIPRLEIICVGIDRLQATVEEDHTSDSHSISIPASVINRTFGLFLGSDNALSTDTSVPGARDGFSREVNELGVVSDSVTLLHAKQRTSDCWGNMGTANDLGAVRIIESLSTPSDDKERAEGMQSSIVVQSDSYARQSGGQTYDKRLLAVLQARRGGGALPAHVSPKVVKRAFSVFAESSVDATSSGEPTRDKCDGNDADGNRCSTRNKVQPESSCVSPKRPSRFMLMPSSPCPREIMPRVPSLPSQCSSQGVRFAYDASRALLQQVILVSQAIMSTQRLCVSPLLGSSLNDALTLGYNKASMLAAIINAGRPELALELGIDPSSIGRCPPLELAQAITALREAEVELKSKSAKGHILDDDLAPFRVASEHAMATILNLLSALSPACFTKRIYDDLAAILGACSPASAAGAGASPGSLNELAEQSSWVHGIDFQYQALNVLVKDGDGLWLNLTQLDPTAVIMCGRESVSMASSYGNLGPFHYIEGQVCVSLSLATESSGPCNDRAPAEAGQ